MALREVRIVPDEVLRKKAKPVPEVTNRIRTLIKDMFQTMDHEDGIGLAAVQVGILKRIFVVSVGDVRRAFINPEILEEKGAHRDYEGCLSMPGESGVVERPVEVKVKAMDEDGRPFVMHARNLLARAILHETDHLNGVLFTDREVEVDEDFEPEVLEGEGLITLAHMEDS